MLAVVFTDTVQPRYSRDDKEVASVQMIGVLLQESGETDEAFNHRAHAQANALAAETYEPTTIMPEKGRRVHECVHYHHVDVLSWPMPELLTTETKGLGR